MTVTAANLQIDSKIPSKKTNNKVINKNENFLAINSVIAKYLRKINLTAFGVWCELLDHPDDWQYYLKNICENLSIGINTLKKSIALLIEYGLVDRIDCRGFHGHFRAKYFVYQTPQPHAKKNLAEDYFSLTNQNLSRDANQNLAPAINNIPRSNYNNVTTNENVNNTNIIAKEMPKKPSVRSLPQKNVDQDKEVLKIVDEVGVPEGQREDVIDVLLEFKDRGREEMVLRVKDAITRAKGNVRGFLACSFRDKWDIQSKPVNAYHSPSEVRCSGDVFYDTTFRIESEEQRQYSLAKNLEIYKKHKDRFLNGSRGEYYAKLFEELGV